MEAARVFIGDPSKSLTNMQAFILIFKSKFAMALIFVPYQYTLLGIVPAAIFSILIALYIFYSLQNFIGIKEVICDELGLKFVSYTYIILHTTTFPKLLIDIIWISREILQGAQNAIFCCCYTYVITFVASLCVDSTAIYYRLTVFCFLLPAMIFYQIASFRAISFYVAFALLLAFISYFILLFDLIFVGLPKINLSEIQAELFQDYKTIPLFVASHVFAVSPISILEAVESTMESPKKLRGWDGVLLVAIALVLISVLPIGLLGVIAFRNKVKINLLEHFLVNNLSYKIILIFLIISMFITTAINFNVLFEIIWQRFFEGKFSVTETRRELKLKAALRAVLILVLYTFTLGWKHLNALIPLVGAFFAVPLSFVYPFVLEFMVVWPERGEHSKWRIAKVIGFSLFGLVICVITIFFTVIHCYEVFKYDK